MRGWFSLWDEPQFSVLADLMEGRKCKRETISPLGHRPSRTTDLSGTLTFGSSSGLCLQGRQEWEDKTETYGMRKAEEILPLSLHPRFIVRIRR